MPLRRFSPGLKAQFAFGMVFLFVQPDASAADISAQQIGGVIIPQAFSQALQDGMSVPLYIHLAGSQGRQDDQRIGSAFIWLDDGQLRIRKIQLEESEDNASVSEQTRQQLMALANAPFNEALTIPLTDNAQLDLSLRQLLLQLVVKREALGTVLRSRSEDIGQSSVNTLSSNLSYNLGVYNNQLRNGGSNTSSYLSLNNVTALREHHVVLDGSLYGIGSGQQDSELYKAMYERDFAGHRFAGGMLDTWNLQSLGPMTAISAGKIYGLSWGNQASSTIFDSSQSATPVIAFLPAAGEVHLTRDGRLLSVQNFTMGNHEVDTRGLPYGIYDVEVEVIVNGRVISKRTQRVNKLFSRGRGVGAPLAWQVWGGSFHMDRWSENGKKTRPAKESWLAGASTSGSLSTLSWAATGYGYDNQAVGETRLTLPLGGAINVNLQNMLASDSSWSSIGSISATLPGGFSSLWVNQEKTRIGNQLRRSDADNRAIGGTLNLNSLWSKLGTFSISYNDDRRYNSHYYTADYYQNVYSGTFGSLGLRAGIQRYNNGDSNANTGKYIALDLSLPLGNWFSAGMTHQNGYTMANLSARKQFDEGTIRTVGANLSRAISGDTGDDKTLSGGAYAQFDARYASGTLNVNSAADGYVNTNLTANGSVGWQGKNIAASGRTDGNAGVIFNTGLEDDGQISAKINGRIFPLNGKRNYLPLSPYGRYEVELQNSKNSLDSYDIVSGRKSRLTLYPGNVAVIEPEVKQMVTVSGRIRAEDGTLLANARINNHIGRTRTDENGEFVMDVDKKYPTIDFRYSGNKTCEVALELNQVRGAVWVGDVVCSGLSSWATVTSGGAKWMHGMLSDAFYQYMQQMPVGSSFTMTINACQTSVNYDASSGARCKDQASGNWYVRNVTHTKAANLRLINTHSLAEVFINSDGVPTLGEGNADCRTQTIGSRSGLSCKMVNYTLQTNGLSNTSIHIFPAIANSSLASAVGAYDMQFSLNGSSWKPVSNTAYYYTFNEMKSADSIYVFFSSNFFKQMVNLGISDINTKDLFNFRFQNTTSPESGWYEFSTSNTLIIKPRDFSISIISDEYTQTPSREGYVGSGESALDFGYIVTTSGKTAADEVLIKVTGPAQVIGGRSYCVFSSDDGKAKVPFPATLSFITRNGATKTYDAGCDDSWRDMTDALWLTTPWTDISGEVGQMDKTTVKFSIPMDNAISLRTVDDNGWFGEVSASGEIHVQATWRNIN